MKVQSESGNLNLVERKPKLLICGALEGLPVTQVVLPAYKEAASPPAERLAEISDYLDEGVYFLDPSRTIRYWNKGAERITGYTAQEVVGRRCKDNILVHTDLAGNHLCLTGCPTVKVLETGQPVNERLFCRHRDGHRATIDVRIVPILDAAGNPAGAFEIMTDRIDAEALRQELQRLAGVASTDFLTGLANRRSMEEQLDLAFYAFQRHGHHFGFVLGDIDHFKMFNDRYGHAVGDGVLKNVASSLHAVLRLDDFGARWGGEEFGVLARHVSQPDNLMNMMERVRRVVETTHLPYQDQNLTVTLSLGGTLVKSSDDRHSLLARADEMLYKSKAAGRNCCSIG